MAAKSPRKLPTEVVVMGITIPVSRDVLPDSHGLFDIDERTGKCEIKIDSVLTDEYAEEILFHEITHAVLHFSGLDAALKNDLDESVVKALQLGLYPLYRRK